MDSRILCLILCAGIASAEFSSFGTTWNWVGELDIKWYLYNQDIVFKANSNPPSSEIIANTFPDSPGDAPWVIENRTCAGQLCSKQLRITADGETLLGIGNQSLEASIMITGRNGKIVEAPFGPHIGNTRMIFRLAVVPPKDSKLPDLIGLFGLDSWMDRSKYEFDNPTTQPMATAQLTIPNPYLIRDSIVRFLGFTRPYDIFKFEFTEARIRGSPDKDNTPTRGAAFNLRLISRPSQYRSMNPLETLWLQIQFSGQGDATARNVIRPKEQTVNPPHNLGYAVASPQIHKFGSYFDSALDVVMLADTPVSGATAFAIHILDASLLENQYILVDFLMNGLSEDDDDYVFSSYICVNGTFGDLCSIEPLVSFERLDLAYMRHINNQLLVPNPYLVNGAIIHIYGDVYSNHASNVMKAYQQFVAGFTISLRTEFYVYPGNG
jgi:hypothetical protein